MAQPDLISAPPSSPGKRARAIRVAIFDDSTVARAMIAWTLEQTGEIEIVATAANGRDAIGALNSAAIDVIILDLEMPQMDGLSALPDLLQNTDAPVLVVSSLTTQGARATIEALRLGAADTLAKPNVTLGGKNARSFSDVLVEKVLSLGVRQVPRRQSPIDHPVDAETPLGLDLAAPIGVIAVAASTGGPTAMFEFFQTLDPAIPLPILVTQHLPVPFVPVLAEHLSRYAKRPAIVADDGRPLIPGTIHIAPGDAHLTLGKSGGAPFILLDNAPAPSGCRPSADPMFASVADVYGDAALAVVMSGMGRDGVEGARKIRAGGGSVIAQDMRSSVVWGMPGAVCRDGLASAVQSPLGLARLINEVTVRRP